MRVPSTNGVDVAVHDLAGPPTAPPILLAHATGFHGLVWRPFAAALADRYRLWAFDERGHGDSTPPDDERYDWHGFADDVLAVVDALDLERPFAVGHSAGGAALLLAEAARPGTFRALYVYEPILTPPAAAGTRGGADENPLVASALRRRATFPSHDDALANFRGKPPFSVLHPDALAAYVEHGFAPDDGGDGDGVHLKLPGEQEAQVYRMGGRHDAWDRLPEIRCPVTVAAGERFESLPRATLEAVVDRLPSARFELFDGLGHFGPLEDPGRVAAAVAAAFAGT